MIISLLTAEMPLLPFSAAKAATPISTPISPAPPLLPAPITPPPNNQPSLNRASAAPRPAPGDQVEELAIVAILVEAALLQDSTSYRTNHGRKRLAEHLDTYAADIQNRLPHTKALIVSVTQDDTPPKISRVLEKLYFEGDDKNANNRLIGTVLVGDIPLPVVQNEQGQGQISLYPYTDFYQKSFIYDYQTDRFEKGDASTPTTEVWHGVIKSPRPGQEGRQQLADFFDKNHQYSIGDPAFAQFDQRALVANLVTEIKQFNPIDYRNYRRYTKYLEELIYKRFNKHFLREVIQEVSRDLNPDSPPDQVTLLMDESAIQNIPDILTEPQIKKYATPLPDALKTYLGKLNNSVAVSGRWDESQLDSAASLISNRDTYTGYYLEAKNTELQNQINQAIEAVARPFQLPAQVLLNIRVLGCDEAEPLANCNNVIHQSQFPFASYVGGYPVSAMNNINQCGLKRGSLSGTATSIVQNNSVLIEGNRIDNPRSAIIPGPDDDTPLEERDDYLEYGGCVANNIGQPQRCDVRDAVRPLFDLAAAKEITSGANCDLSQFHFRPVDHPDAFDDEAVSWSGFPPIPLFDHDEDLDEMMGNAYRAALATNRVAQVYVPPEYVENEEETARKQASAVLEYLMQNNTSFTYRGDDNIFIQLNTVPVYRPVPGTIKHVEPTEQTYRTIRSSLVSKSLPADAIHTIEFNNAQGTQIFAYPNFFEIEGSTLSQISQNFLQLIQQKNDELNRLLGASGNIILNFALQNTDLIEPMHWQNLTPDQKHLFIFDKYLNQGTTFPAPPGLPPRHRPTGYEVFYLNAQQGDAQSFRYQVHGSILEKEGFKDPEADAIPPPGTTSQTLRTPVTQSRSGGRTQERLFSCGDPSGVEIWQWFQAVECWLTEEVLPASQLISLDNACFEALPEEEEEVEEEAEQDALDEVTFTPASLRINLARRTLTVGSKEIITIQALNNKDQVIASVLDGEVTASLSNPSLGTLSATQFPLSLGEGTTTLTTSSIGEGTVLISYLGLTASVAIRVVENLQLNISATREADATQQSYLVRLELLDDQQNLVQDVAATVQLNTLRHRDGVFKVDGQESRGIVTLQNGVGQIQFLPAPDRPLITLVAESPLYGSASFDLRQPANPAHHIEIESPEFLWIQESRPLSLRVVDQNGLPVEWQGTLDAKVTQATQAFGRVSQSQIPIQNGTGTVDILTSSETGPLNVIISGPNLQPALLKAQIYAGMQSEQLKNLPGNDLFATFFGFPAGDTTTPDYFGGTHLFQKDGKTQAVYAEMSQNLPPPLLTLHPNRYLQVSEARYTVHPQIVGRELFLQAYDEQAQKEIFSSRLPFQFSSIEVYDDEKPLAEGVAYLETRQSQYSLIAIEGGYQVVDRQQNQLLKLTPDQLSIFDPRFSLRYITDPDHPVITLELLTPEAPVARLHLNFLPQRLSSFNLTYPNEFQLIAGFTGNSSHDFSSLLLIDPEIPSQEAALQDDQRGWHDTQKHLLLFAGGNLAGDSTKFNLPLDAILLGDPTIRLQPIRHSGLDYDGSVGQKIYQDPKGETVVAITETDFNHDGEKDIVAALKDGRIRLLEGGPTQPPFRDRGDLAFVGDGVVAIMDFDFAADNFPDVLVATREGRLAILHNDRGKLTRTNKQLRVGKQIYQILKEDMDADGAPDLVTQDSRGDIRIFYNTGNDIPENGTLVENYGFSINTQSDLSGALKIRYPGMPEPASNSPSGGAPNRSGQAAHAPSSIAGPLSQQTDQALRNFLNRSSSQPVDESTLRQLALDQQASSQALSANQPASIPKLPWPEGEAAQTFFQPLGQANFLSATKRVQNKARPQATDLDLGETLLYTLTLQSSRRIQNLVLADTVPDALSVELKSITCASCGEFEKQQNGTLLFLSNITLPANQPVTLTYEATVKHTPRANILIKRMNVPADAYLDLAVSPAYNNTGQLIEHYTTSAKQYAVRATPPPNPADNPIQTHLSGLSACQEVMTAPPPAQIDEDEPPDTANLQGGMNACIPPTQNPVANPNLDLSGQSTGDPDTTCSGGLDCANQALDNIINAINDFSCSSAGCFPLPVNAAFLVPGNPVIPFYLPILAFPTTLPTPFGPIPFLWPPMILGATTRIPGPIMSLLRLYLSPSLTGGMGIAFCWGPDLGTAVPPPPLIPIPYPPPIGNCLVQAIRVIPTPVCKEIENVIEMANEAVNSVISDINSGIESITKGDAGEYLGASTEAVTQQNSGGLEVSLAIDLGNKHKFDPPDQGFSNIHISALDSLGGVISDWWDRQVTEFQNKLLVLPNIQIVRPDFGALFTPDTEQIEQSWNAILDQFSSDPAARVKTSQEIWQTQDAAGQSDAGTQLFKTWELLDESLSSTNINIFERIYDLLNSFPFVNITERPVDFKIPWLSPQQIRTFITELKRWKDHMELELKRVADSWAQFVCPAAGTDVDAESAAANCRAEELANKFIVDFQKTLDSIEANIEVLESYLKFPRQIVKFKKQTADYLTQIGCYLETWSTLLGGWQSTVREQLISYAEFYYTIVAVVEQIEELFNLFVDFEDNCDLCTNERTHWFGWFMLLGFVIPDIPIIKFPKIPDIVIDLSDVKTAINIELPTVNFVGEPILLPKLPYLRLPDVPDLSMFLSFPALPVLPKLPELPDLPSLPPLPTVNLPTLPPPPKIPDIGQTFGAIIPLLDKILEIWCLVKKAFTPIPESMLYDQITLMTQRPAYLIPLDLLTGFKFPDIAPFDLGFNELQINVHTQLGIRIKDVWVEVDKAAQEWNAGVTDLAGFVDRYTQQWLKDKAAELQQTLDTIDETLEEKFGELEDFVQQNLQAPLDRLGEESAAIEQELNNQIEPLRQKIKEIESFLEQQISSATGAEKEALTELNERIRRLSRGLDRTLQDIDPTDWANDQVEQLKRGLQQEIDKANQKIKENGFELQHGQDGDPANQPSKTDKQSSLPLQQTLSTLNQIASIIRQDSSTLVDYKVIKERLGVPDVQFKNRPTQADKIDAAKRQLYAQADSILQAVDQGHFNDLQVIAQTPVEALNQLARAEGPQNKKAQRILSSGVPPPPLARNSSGSSQPIAAALRNKKIANLNLTGAPTLPATGSSGVCVGSCLKDPITGQTVNFITYADDFGSMKTVFVETPVQNKSHVIYQDGPSIYLKRNLTLADNPNRNAPSRLFGPRTVDLDRLLPYGESVNLLSVSIQGNQASQFGWRPSNNPKVYGHLLELEMAIAGFDADEQQSSHPDLKIILLPVAEDGTSPAVLADEELISLGTLVVREENTDDTFPIKARQTKTGIRRLTFPTLGNKVINLKPGVGIYLDEYLGAGYSFQAQNGFYQLKASWFDQSGNVTVTNQNEVMAPQIYGNQSQPIVLDPDQKILIPIYKERVIRASEIFTDLTGAWQFAWDVNQDGLPEVTGPEYTITPQKEPKQFALQIKGSPDLTDAIFDPIEATVQVEIYVPKITLEEPPLKARAEVKGTLVPREIVHDLSNIPFSLFRKRWDVWKNIGNTTTTPPVDATQSYLSQNIAGNYLIKGLNTSDKRIGIRDGQNQDIAYVLPDTGQIHLLNESLYELRALPADETHSTRIGIFEVATGRLLNNVYYIPDQNTDVTIINEPLTAENLFPIGVTIGDLNSSDQIIARNIPGFAPSYPGGAAIFNQTLPQKNIALIASNGAIRLMQPGFKLSIKNPGRLAEKIIFTIQDSSDRPLFDIFIAADFTAPQIRQDEVWDATNVQIGLLPSVSTEYSLVSPVSSNSNTNSNNKFQFHSQLEHTGLVDSILSLLSAHAAPQVPANPNQSPFPDVAPTHPQFKAILDLYQRRMIKGYEDGSFRPDQKLSRAEFVKIALGSTNCFDCTRPTDPQRQRYSSFNPFPDVAFSAWYYFCIAIAKELGMVTGYGDGLFRPEQQISRAEAAAVLLRQSQIPLLEIPANTYLDVPDYAWYKDYVHTAVKIGLIPQQNGLVKPEEKITRAEFAFMADWVFDIKDCRAVDSDGDGTPDPKEVDSNLDPLDKNDAPKDNDGDTLRNGTEANQGTDPNNPDTDGDTLRDDVDPLPLYAGDPKSDEDRDNLTAQAEAKIGTDPRNPDTDGDRLRDDLDPNPLISATAGGTGTSDSSDISGGDGVTGGREGRDTNTPDGSISDGRGQVSDGQRAGDQGSETGSPIQGVCPYQNNPNQANKDGDAFIDVCDNDIDNDGVLNALGIYGADGLIDAAALASSDDNCVFDVNPGQEDSDQNGIGDVCEVNDLCPEIPEDLDGTDDLDGCPEVVDNIPPEIPGVIVNHGPACYFVDYVADLVPGDTIMTAITDLETHETVFSKSPEIHY